jgi:hypothetical protein
MHIGEARPQWRLAADLGFGWYMRFFALAVHRLVR